MTPTSPTTIFLLSRKGDVTSLLVWPWAPVPVRTRTRPGDFNNDVTPDLVVSDYYSSALVLMLNRPGTYIGLKGSSATARAGQPVTVTLSLSRSVAGAGQPSGAVASKDNGKTVSIAHLSAGKAEFTTTKSGAGTHHITASYWGSNDFNPHVSSPVSFSVE
jgi:hypothetical protein